MDTPNPPAQLTTRSRLRNSADQQLIQSATPSPSPAAPTIIITTSALEAKRKAASSKPATPKTASSKTPTSKTASSNMATPKTSSKTAAPKTTSSKMATPKTATKKNPEDNGESSSGKKKEKEPTSKATATIPKNRPTPKPAENLAVHRSLRHRTTRHSTSDTMKSPTSDDQGSEPTYRVGQKLEANDEHGKWYAARVVDFDEDSNSILIHFDYWSTRYDEWIDIKSGRLRPILEQPRVDKDEVYKVGDFIQAKWSMGKYYPAKILDVIDENRFNVMYYDGVQSVVRRRELRPIPEEELRKIDVSIFGQPECWATQTVETDTEASTVDSATSQTVETPNADRSPSVLLSPSQELEEDQQRSLNRRKSAVVQQSISKQKEDGRTPRKAAIGVALAVAQLTPATRRKPQPAPETSATAMASDSINTTTSESATDTSCEIAQPSDEPKNEEKMEPRNEEQMEPENEEKMDVVPEPMEKVIEQPMLAEMIGLEAELTEQGDTGPEPDAIAQIDVVPKPTEIDANEAKTPEKLSSDVKESAIPEQRAAPKRKSTRSAEKMYGEPTEKRMSKRKAVESSSNVSSEKKGKKTGMASSKDSSEIVRTPRATPSPAASAASSTSSGKKKGRGSGSEGGESTCYRQYKFKPEWHKEYEWLGYAESLMFCKYCRQVYPDAKHGFVVGIESGFLMHRLTNHGLSRFHIAAMEQLGIPCKKEPQLESEIAGSSKMKRSGSSVEAAEQVGASGEPSDEGERAQRLFLFWRNGRESWLRMENKKFFCKACRLHGGQASLWSVGIPLNQANNIRRHGQSLSHQAAMQHLLELEKDGESCATPELTETQTLPPPQPAVAQASPTFARPGTRGSRKRKQSEGSEDSNGSHSLSTVTAAETSASSAERKQAERDRQGAMSDQEGSTRSSSLSHLAEDDVVRCLCETGGEDGLMLQCEQCMTWQHGNCVGIDEPEATPADYICYVCKHPPGSRATMRYQYETEKTWLESGVLPRFPWSQGDGSPNFAKTRMTAATNSASRIVAMLNDRLRATRHLIHRVNKLPHGPAMIERKAAIKDEIMAIQETVEKELDSLEPFVSELEQKYLSGRTSTAELEFAQSKLAVCTLIRELDKLRKVGYFLQ